MKDQPNSTPLDIHVGSTDMLSMAIPDGAAITAAANIRGNYVFDDGNGNEILKITPTQFIFKGEVITDAGRAYDGFTYMLEQRGFLPSQKEKLMGRIPRPLSISFLAEQEALTKQPVLRASDLTEPTEPAPLGFVRVHRKRDDWFLSLATEETIPAVMSAVHTFLNKGNPKPFSEEQLKSIYLAPDQRNSSTHLSVMLPIEGGEPVAVAFLSGPLLDTEVQK